MMRILGIIAVLALSAAPGAAEQGQFRDQPGDAYEIRREYESSSQTGDRMSSSSSGHDTIVERVIGTGEQGLELEYDLPADAAAENRAADWQFPARVLKPFEGPMRLLNAAELEARVDSWLAKAGWPREVCGRWIFTWNAFQIECDPQSVLETLRAFDLRHAVHEGESYRDPRALEPGILRRIEDDGGELAYVADMPVDPDAVRRERAEADVAVAQINGEELALDAALRHWSDNPVSGTITVVFDVDSAGDVRRRTTVTRLQVTEPDLGTENSIHTETVERQRMSGR